MEGDQTFRVNFTGEGAARLRERVKEKLREFMGDYTDDTLVEYVIVLLKNGRSKDGAKSELDVFLGDDSESFISWLWDHLGSNLSLYIQQPEPHQDGLPTTKSAAQEPGERTKSDQVGSGTEKGNSEEKSGKRHKRGWKGLVGDGDDIDVPIPQKSMAETVNTEDEPHHRVGRTKISLSPRPTIKKKRRQSEERQPRKRDISQTAVSAPRRLLLSAVRDAVAPSRPSNTSVEPSLKRLRSVVSTSTGDSILEEHPQSVRPAARARTSMSAAIKAVAEAAKDVSKVRPSRNVFDRLGRATDVSNTINHQEDHRDFVGVDRDFSNERETRYAYFQPNDSNMQRGEDASSFHDEPIMASDVRYDGVDLMGHGDRAISQSGASGGEWVEEPVTIYPSESDDFDEKVRRARETLELSEAAYHPSTKNSSPDYMNTKTIPEYQAVEKVSEMEHQNSIRDSDTVISKPEVWLLKENINVIPAANGNAKPVRSLQQDSEGIQAPTGLHSAGPPMEDADSRTIYVSNVHFAATKDSLSRHFNKFGEVLKVVILTDPATGQPKGSAYIEFLKKEAAEHAISLDGTSFMSRILKILRKSSAQLEAAPIIAWPRVARASPFTVPRYTRGPYARGVPSLYRPRIPMKPGVRSFQWKREAQPTIIEASGQAQNNIVPPPAIRSLTYVRTESTVEAKTNGSSGTA